MDNLLRNRETKEEGRLGDLPFPQIDWQHCYRHCPTAVSVCLLVLFLAVNPVPITFCLFLSGYLRAPTLTAHKLDLPSPLTPPPPSSPPLPPPLQSLWEWAFADSSHWHTVSIRVLRSPLPHCTLQMVAHIWVLTGLPPVFWASVCTSSSFVFCCLLFSSGLFWLIYSIECTTISLELFYFHQYLFLLVHSSA